MYHNIEGEKFQSAGNPTWNHFFNTFYTAWLTHGEIVLSPDDFWFQISLLFAEYVAANSGKFRSEFVDFEGIRNLVLY